MPDGAPVNEISQEFQGLVAVSRCGRSPAPMQVCERYASRYGSSSYCSGWVAYCGGEFSTFSRALYCAVRQAMAVLKNIRDEFDRRGVDTGNLVGR